MSGIRGEETITAEAATRWWVVGQTCGIQRNHMVPLKTATRRRESESARERDDSGGERGGSVNKKNALLSRW